MSRMTRKGSAHQAAAQVKPVAAQAAAHVKPVAAQAAAQVIGVGESAAEALDEQLKGWLDHYEQVPSVTDAEAVTGQVRRVQGRLWVDRIEATIEAHTLATARVREACDIPGTSVRTAWLCRDKPSMKQALREAGVPTAASAAVGSAAEALAFAEQVGFPLILKPRSEAGASDTMRAEDAVGLERALDMFGGQGVGSIAMEEFVEGHEGFYDTITVDGQVAVDFVSHYYPNVLEAMRYRWISPQFISTNRIDTVPEYAELRDKDRQAVSGSLGRHPKWANARSGAYSSSAAAPSCFRRANAAPRRVRGSNRCWLANRACW